MEQVVSFEFPVYGAGGDDIFDGHDLALEAWGDRAKDNNSGLLAIAYLWRRFGPPWHGGDEHKSLVDYVLTTEDPQVFLWLHLGGSGLALSVGYLAHDSIRKEAHRPVEERSERYEEWWQKTHPELESLEDTPENQQRVEDVYWQEREDKEVQAKALAAIGPRPPRLDNRQWRTDTGVVHRVNQALFDALKELERPVYVRDVAINIFGRCDDTDSPAEQSKYAGYGIPQQAMDDWIGRHGNEVQGADDEVKK